MPWTAESKLIYELYKTPIVKIERKAIKNEANRRNRKNREARGQWSRDVASKTHVEIPFPVTTKA